MKNKKLKEKIEALVARANFSLRNDVRSLLLAAYRRENDKRTKKALDWILRNAEIADNQHLAICQDTGLPVIFIEAGKKNRLDSRLVAYIKTQVEKSYRKYFLRPSLVDPLQRGRPSFSGAPCHIDFRPKIRGLRVTVLPKGFGCENKTQLRMFNPTVQIDEIESFVVECVRAAGPEACPPFVVGVGIGGTSDSALLLAKKALLGDIRKINPDKTLAAMEKRLLRRINSLNIGVMALGGRTTCLKVKIKKAPTHIAGLPVGVNISCHALRSATMVLK